MKTLIRAAALGALLTGSALQVQAQPHAPPAAATAPSDATTLNLAASGQVRIAPDLANITVGVMTEGPSAAEASRANAERMNQVVAALRRQGIAERDIQTSGLNLNPQYAYEPNQPPRLTGYQASNTVTIRVLELARLGSAIDAAVSSGANQVHGISFGLRNPTAAEDEARRRAVQALQAKANLYAQATGLRLGRMVNLTEGGGYTPTPPMPMGRLAMVSKDESTPVAPGELEVRIDITGIYELGR